MDALAATEDSASYKDYYATQPPSAQGYYDTSGGAPPQSATDLGSQVGADNGGFAIEHGDGEGDDDDEDETRTFAFSFINFLNFLHFALVSGLD